MSVPAPPTTNRVARWTSEWKARRPSQGTSNGRAPRSVTSETSSAATTTFAKPSVVITPLTRPAAATVAGPGATSVDAPDGVDEARAVAVPHLPEDHPVARGDRLADPHLGTTATNLSESGPADP